MKTRFPRMLSGTLLAALGVPQLSQATTTHCLTRGIGATEHFLAIEALDTIEDWMSQGPILIHKDVNMPTCSMLGAPCNVAAGDIVTVVGNSQGQLILNRIRPTGRPVSRDKALMLPSADGRYLSGFSTGIDDGAHQQVFLYYRGTGHCTDTGLDYPAAAQCRFFEFETFPVGVLQADRPDAPAAQWMSGPCPTTGQQPGGGSGVEPPIDPP